MSSRRARFVLAIDQGTTGTTALILDEGANTLATAYSEFGQHFPAPGWVEHDPEEIWRSVVDVVSLVLARLKIAPQEIAGIGITNQRETTVVWDRKTSRPVHNAIVWQDRRTTEICARLQSLGASELISQRSGLRIDPYFSATKLTWMLENIDGLRSRTNRGELAFGTIDSWLVWKLTNGESHVTDATNASRTMLMDLASSQWDEELLELMDIPPSLLPRIVPSASSIGECAAEHFGSPIPITGILGDQQSALFGQACVRPGETKNTYGTGSFVLQHTGPDLPDPHPALVRTAAFSPRDGPPEFALEGSIFATGAAVQWLRDGISIISDASETAALAASLSSNDDVYFVPALAGLGSPWWDPSARGTLIGATRGTSRAHLARAVLESIAFQTRDVIDSFGLEKRPPELRADGGAAANPWLMQFQADILGIPVDVAEVREATSLGAAFASGIGAGLYLSLADLDSFRKTGRRYEPKMREADREALYERWQEAVGRSLQWA